MIFDICKPDIFFVQFLLSFDYDLTKSMLCLAISDDIHLLQFLRAKKYNVNNAMQAFEQCYLARKSYPKFVPDSYPNLNKVLQFLQTGYCYPLTGRDSDGCRIIFFQTRRLDAEKYSICDGLKFAIFIFTVLMEEEETQIAGIKYFYDDQDITIKHIMHPKDAVNFIDLIKNVPLGRTKAFHVINLPTIAYFTLEIIRGVLSEKLKSRLFLHRSWSKLEKSKHIDFRMLPKELGGLKPEAEIIKEFEALIIERWEKICEVYNKSDIDFTKVPSFKFRSNRSEKSNDQFKKLEID